MNKLINLRFIEADYYGVPQFEGIGQLIYLQGRVTFQVQNKSGWKISELKGLNHLHGELVVHGLEHVKSKEEAEQACLKHKVHLEALVLRWGAEEEEETKLSSVQQEHAVDSQQVQEYVRNDVESQVLEGLFPPPNLKVLKIFNNRGARFPSWMEEHRCSISSSLVTLKLDGCCKWECLPTLGRFPSLKKLTIKKARSVKKIGPEFYGEIDNIHGRGIINNKGYSYFPRLKYLSLGEMSLWEEWEMPAAGEMDGGGGTGGGRHGHGLFPSLRMLHICSCPKLPSLSPVLRHLTKLENIGISGCDELASLEEEGDGCGWVLPSLREFSIKECPKLASLTLILGRSTNLERIEIEQCAELTSLEEEGDGCGWVLPSLRQLSIKECPKLASLTPILRHSTNLRRIEIKKCAELAWSEEGDGCGWMLPSGLEELSIDDNSPKLPSLSQMLPHSTALLVLEIYGFHNLQCLPLSIHNLHSLQLLYIKDCPAIECLSDGGLRLPSLRFLRIRGCPLLEWRYREGGPDALNIPTTTRVAIEPPLPELEG